MTTPRQREGWAAKAVAERFDAKAGPVADDLLRLFKKTLRDQTPQQRRVLAGEIALVIPDENEGRMQGHQDPLWMQSLRAFARRELELEEPNPVPAVRSAIDAKTVKAEELDNRIRSAIDLVLDQRRGNQDVLLNKTAVAEQMGLSRQGLEAAMNGCGLRWEPYGRLVHGAKKNA